MSNATAIPRPSIPRPNTRRSAYIVGNGNTTFAVIGDATTVTGTAGGTPPVVSGDPGDYLVSLTSGAVSGNQGAVHGALNQRTANRMTFQALVRPGAVITLARAWVGLWEVAVTTILTAGDTPGASAHFGFGFRRSTAIPDTNWQAVVSNGAADTVVDTGVAYAASTSYELQIDWEPAASAQFSINGVLKATVAATLPTGSLLRMGAGVQTLEALGKQFDVGWMYCEKE